MTRIRQLFFLLFLTGALLLSAGSLKAQDINTHRVRIGLKGENLLRAITEIEKQSSFRFYYRKAEVEAVKELTIPAENRTIAETMTLLLKNTSLSFRQVDNNIFIEKKQTEVFQVKGRVTGPAGQPIEFAAVSLYADQQLLKTGFTDTSGIFQLTATEKRKYRLHVSALGMDSADAIITIAEPVTVLQDVSLKLKEGQLKEVTITGNKPLLERKTDRLIYNVERSIVAQGGDGLDVLSSTPLIRVDENGNVFIAGKSSVAVMVNDRLIRLSGTELAAFIRSIRSENISRIEVITAPPAKYEAQGNSGLVNFVLKKNPYSGWSGYLTAGQTQATYSTYGVSGGLNYGAEKLTASLKLRGWNSQKNVDERYVIQGNSSSSSHDDRYDTDSTRGMYISLDYKPNERSNAGLVYDMGGSHSGMDIINNTDYYNGMIYTKSLTTGSQHRSRDRAQTLNAYYDLKLSKSKLSFAGNFYDNTPQNTVDFRTKDLSTDQTDTVRTLSSVHYRIYSGQADLTSDLKTIKLETGLKYTSFSNNSDIGYYDLVQGNYQQDPQRSNLFDYAEKNYAAYVSADKNWGKWSAKLGMRYEYAEVEGYSPSSGDRNKYKYGRFFPSAYLNWQISADHQLGVNYTKRIDRPNFRAVNPFRWYTNPYSYYSGNPQLQPSYNHNVEFNYIFRGKLAASLFYQRMVNGYDQLSFLSGLYEISTFENFYNQYNIGLQLNYTEIFFKRWELNSALSYQHVRAEANTFGVEAQSGSSLYYSLFNNIVLNKARTLILLVNYWQNLPQRDGNSYYKTRANLTIGIKASFWSKKLQVNFNVNDILRQYLSRGTNYYQDNVQTFNNYYDLRKSNLSLTWNFGNDKVKGANRKIDFSEKNRSQ
nr:TonB-dependent receptor [Sediminibacterium ginsengisoli]